MLTYSIFRIRMELFIKSKLLEKDAVNLKNLLHQIPIGIIIKRNLTVMFYNKYIDSLINKMDDSQISNPSITQLIDDLTQVYKEGHTRYSRNGIFYEIEFKQVQIFGANNIMILLKDISTVIEEEKIKNFKRFSFAITHELRTPLSSISGMLQLIKPYASPPIDSYLSAADISCNLLQNIANDYLDYYKFQDGKLKLICSDFDMHSVLSELTEIMTFQANLKKLQLNIDYSKLTFSIAKGDERRVKQVLLDLFSNGIKFTEKGSISVHCYNDENYITTSIKDTGCGIPKESIAQLFTNNSQANEKDNICSRTFNLDIGFSLIICKILAQQMNGEIIVESEVNEGSTFLFRLPKGEAISKKTLKLTKLVHKIMMPPQVITLKSKSSFEVNALIIDEVPFNIFALKQILKVLNIQSEECSDIQHALNLVKQCNSISNTTTHKIELILIDLDTKLNWLNFLSELHKLEQSGRVENCIKFGITSFDDEKLKEKGNKEGINEIGICVISTKANMY